jgi:aminodeoxyfutalosine synthase
MLYGHVETVEERVGHLVKLRELQDESLQNCGSRIADCGLRTADNPQSEIRNPKSTLKHRGYFNCIIPLSFIPEHSELGHLPGPTGLTDLRTLAIARLMLDNFSHVKAFWIMQGVHLSQLALDWGCDDLDGTVVWYDITKRAGGAGNTHQELHVADIKRLIREADKTPAERDTLYRPVHRDPATDRVTPLAEEVQIETQFA